MAGITAEQKKALADAARAVRERAYAPYSRFKVGAAVLADDGTIYAGCNVESASFGATICAERAAVCAAVAGGSRAIAAVCVAGGDDWCYPCGICRQLMLEFGQDMTVLVCGGSGAVREHTLGELMPHGFAGFKGD